MGTILHFQNDEKFICTKEKWGNRISVINIENKSKILVLEKVDFYTAIVVNKNEKEYVKS